MACRKSHGYHRDVWNANAPGWGLSAGAAIVGAGLAVAMALGAAAQPQVPSTFYGSAAVDGKPVPGGTEVRGYVGGVDCTQLGPSYRGSATEGGVSVYIINVMHESQKAGCGTPGKTVTFTVGGRVAAQTAEWKQGPQQVNLNAGSGQAPELPTATPTRALAPSEVAATATEQAKYTPKPATALPTDEVVIALHTRTAAGGVEGQGGAGDLDTAEGEGLAPGYVLLVALGTIVLTGAAAGLALSRRAANRPAPPGSDGNGP